MEEISIEDFSKADIRIGTVVKAEVPGWSHWVMKLTVDFSSKGRSASGRGEDIGIRTIFSGIMKFYVPEDLEGKQFPFVVNLKPKRIGPAMEDGKYNYSQGMMIMAAPSSDSRTGGQAASDEEEIKPVLFSLMEKVLNGSKVR